MLAERSIVLFIDNFIISEASNYCKFETGESSVETNSEMYKS